ncbi:hypothetical protein ACSSVZ_005314 [Amorphus sp. MBR-141]
MEMSKLDRVTRPVTTPRSQFVNALIIFACRPCQRAFAAIGCLKQAGVPFAQSGCNRILVGHEATGGVTIEFCEEVSR